MASFSSTIHQGKGGLEFVTISHESGAEADIYLYGAHVTRFEPTSTSGNILYMSEKSEFVEGKAIRGGIPLIFPQFRFLLFFPSFFHWKLDSDS